MENSGFPNPRDNTNYPEFGIIGIPVPTSLEKARILLQRKMIRNTKMEKLVMAIAACPCV
jgi:hypothetical protein